MEHPSRLGDDNAISAVVAVELMLCRRGVPGREELATCEYCDWLWDGVDGGGGVCTLRTRSFREDVATLTIELLRLKNVVDGVAAARRR